MPFLTHPAFIWTVVVLAVLLILFIPFSFVLASSIIYNKTLRRTSKKQWSRDVPSTLAPDSVSMYNAGLEWANENAEFKKDVHTIRDGINLYGEYYDFGFKRCAVILSGRTEALKYGYYFAIPYHKAGCNIMVLDPRGHGHSDGEFNTVGFEESRDITRWINHMHEEYGIDKFIYHGICIGAAGGMLSITSDEAPVWVEAIVTEGMFPCFAESMKNHLRERRKPVITVKLIDAWMKHYTGHTMTKGPINVISKLNRPLLMLHSREDTYSTPDNAQKLFDLAGTDMKRIEWFPHGRHSFLRITDTERYDNAIMSFVKELDDIKAPASK